MERHYFSRNELLTKANDFLEIAFFIEKQTKEFKLIFFSYLI